MARGTSFTELLTALFVLLLLHQTFSVKDINLAVAGCSSSCGSIQNIRYPFRLMEDPPNCGDQRYNLSCENNTTVLYLYAGKYHVQEINYGDYSIRVVDSGIQRDNFSSIPRYFLGHYNFSTGDPYSLSYPLTIPMAFLSYEKQVNSTFYRKVSTNCFKKVGVHSSNYSSSSSQMYSHVAYYLTPYPEEVEESCRLEVLSLISRESYKHSKTDSCEEIHNELLNGFKLHWFQLLYCECGVGYKDYCFLDEANRIQCEYIPITMEGSSGLLKRLEGVYHDIMHALGRISGSMIVSPKELILLVFYIGRRKNLNAFAEHSSQICFATWVYNKLYDGNDIDMEEFATKEEEEIGKLMIIVALCCIQMKPSDRPSMNKVVEMLEGEVKCLQLPPKPFFSLPDGQIEDKGKTQS